MTQITNEELQAIKELVEYLEDTGEEADYNQWKEDIENDEQLAGVVDSHVWNYVVKLREMLNREMKQA